MKLFFYDLETTGLDSKKHGIHQISGKIVINGKTAETFNYNVRPAPDALIDESALEIAGVTKEQIMVYPYMYHIYSALTNMLEKYISKYDRMYKFFLVGYNNVAFDNQFFREFFLKNNDKYFGSYFWANSLDVMVLATLKLAKVRHMMPNFKLATVARQLGIEVNDEKLHDAGYDICLTKAIYDIVAEQ